MSRSKHAVELCALLVDETYGELTSRIFTILLRRGRLPIYALSSHTRLTRHQVQHGLAVLIQQNLVYHSLDPNNKTTYYEANHETAYALVRSGKVMELVENRYGSLAKDVVQNLLLLGLTKVSDLADAYVAASKPHMNGNGNGTLDAHGKNGNFELKSVNGQSERITSAGQLDSILCELLKSGLVEPVVERMLRSPTDTYNQIEKEVLELSFGGSTKGTKQKEELKMKVRDRMKTLRDEGQDWRPKGNKRSLDGDLVNGHGKRQKLSIGGGAVAVTETHVFQDEGIKLERDLVVRINYEKFTVALRNQRLVELANSRIGETTSHVYRELLRLMEKKIPRCRLDPRIDDIDDLLDGPFVTTLELTAALSKSINVGLGIGKVSSDKVDTKRLEKSQKLKKPKVGKSEADVEGEASEDEAESAEDVDMNGNGNIPEVDEDSAGDADDPFDDDPVVKTGKRAKVTFQDKLPKSDTYEDRQNRLLKVKNHLLLLSADSYKFLRRCGNNGHGEWTVDFETLMEQVRESELDAIILENFGQSGHRLVRMLKTLGKLEEKALPNLALMKQKDIRTKMAEMQMAGMVDIQEVPRDANRTTNRTMFLWFFDADRVSSILLDSIYKAMSRCLQRLEVEKRRASGILSMAERTDVRNASEEEALNGEQMNMLLEIRGKEEKLLGQIGRLDGLVSIFRDY